MSLVTSSPTKWKGIAATKKLAGEGEKDSRIDLIKTGKRNIMSPLSLLPERLRYLQPFRKKFTAQPPEELNEDTGVAPLFALLHKRIKGLSTVEAENLLREDGVALQSWLSAPEQQNDCLHFALVFLSMISPSELVNQVREEARKLVEPKPSAEIDLPEGAKLRKDSSLSKSCSSLLMPSPKKQQPISLMPWDEHTPVSKPKFCR